jgi:outer membrane receptor protein involved in Fe transport
VTDGTGAVIPDAQVTAINVATGVSYQAVTDRTGTYHITQLPPGNYTMQIAHAGFETQSVRAFQLYIDQHLQQNIALTIGKTVETVSVSAAALLLDTQSSNQSQLIQNQQINDMPLNGRDVLQLAQLSAGVTPVTSGMSSPASSWTGTQVVSIMMGGLREDDTSYLYDGIETRNAWYGADGLMPNPDVVQEFKVEPSGSSAQFGDGGSFVTIVSRGGTNSFHGDLYEYFRNNDLNARNYFNTTSAPPPYHQNQFGASLGGPIKRRRMFFFINYEGYRQISSADEYTNVPTAAQIAGDFSADSTQLVNPKVMNASGTGYADFTGNQVPSQYWDSVDQKILALYPSPNGSFVSNSNNYHYIQQTTNNWDQGNARFDWQLSPKNTLFVRFTDQSSNEAITALTKWGEVVYPSNPRNLAVGWTHILSPTLVNNLNYGWSHTAVGEARFDGYTAADANPLGLTNEIDEPGSYGYPQLGITNYGDPGTGIGADIVREGMNMWTDSLMWQRGKHQLTVGADIRYQPIYMYEDWKASTISFNGTETGDAIADVLVGVPSSAGNASGDPELNLRTWYQAYYLQDNWKLNHRLSFNLGARWEHASPPYDTANHVGTYDFATNEDLNYPDTDSLGLGRNMVDPHWYNWSPRVGFNYNPLANWDIKGGFGLYYLQPNINQYEVEVDTTKYYLIKNYTQANLGSEINFTTSNLFSDSVSGTDPFISFIQRDGKTPYVYEWNLSLERTIKSWLLTASYVGNATHHYEVRTELDPEEEGAVYPVSGWAALQENANVGSSNYHGLVASVEHHYSSGFSVLGSYTFSKALGVPWQDQFTWHPLDLAKDRGHVAWDMNQNLTINAIYELPFGRGKKWANNGRLTDEFVGGWKLSTIAAFRSGPWLTLGSDQSLGTFVNSLPNVTGAVNNSSLHGGLGKNGKVGPYFNTQNVEAITTVGLQGNAGVGNLQSPGSAKWDISADKTWSLIENCKLTFRADVFNAFNRVNFYNLSTDVNSSTFGNVTSAQDARIFQLSARFAF